VVGRMKPRAVLKVLTFSVNLFRVVGGTSHERKAVPLS
jgi:hypothetical protein